MIAPVLRFVGSGAIVVALVVVAAAVESVRLLHTPLSVPAAGATLEVAKGATLSGVAADLVSRKILERADVLRWFGRLSGQAARIKAGEYALRPGDTVPTLLARMVRGDTLRYRIALIEGWTVKQFRQALAAEPRLRQLSAGLGADELMQELGRAGQHPEGRFFPDTYVFSRGQSDLDILRNAAVAMDKQLKAAWQKRVPDLPYQTPYDALIMASIVEKETGAAEERARIAGVFVRRLRKDMKLQTDPTIIYGLGERYQGDIKRKHLTEDTPYNTYVHKGLTPTPIANPGADALRAAVNPEPGTVLYFVSRGDGTHKFSDTYKEHARAVRQFQLSKQNK